MNTAKVFTNGKSQAVRLPKEFRFNADEVYVKKLGEVVYLFPKDSVHDIFAKSLHEFPDDFMADGRDQGINEVRENF
ncbi:MAG: type II toxin-antitoxin system VapB family antitoxin [Clostridiales Family XIII bacterium]|jgi:antitoxin VapB|nr:type II toxin-antitoxin system VapB family antitoxin [Clostridiales Family XIII bacterium]